MSLQADVVIVGAGNAAMCAALSAHEHGASVIVLERAPMEERGGNTAYTAGAMRVAYRGVEDLLTLMPDLSEEERARTDFGTYDQAQFFDDMARVTEYRTDPDLAELLVARSLETMAWMRAQGIRFQPIYGRQAFKVGGRFRFWGGLTVEAWGGGRELVDAEFRIAEARGVRIFYDARALALVHDDAGVHGVVARIGGRTQPVKAKAVI